MNFWKREKTKKQPCTYWCWVYPACPERGRRGFTLLEMLIYLSLLSVLSVLSVRGLLAMTETFSGLRAGRELNDSALVAMEKLTREITAASSIDLIESDLDAHPGKLVLNTSDESGGTVETVFFLESGTLRVERDGTDIGPLTSENVSVGDLVFTRITTDVSEAVKIDMELTVERGKTTKQKRYHSTRILREAY